MGGGGEWKRRMLHFEACWVSRIQKGGAGEAGARRKAIKLRLWLAGCLFASSTRLHPMRPPYVQATSGARRLLPHRCPPLAKEASNVFPQEPPPHHEIKQNNRLRNSLLSKKTQPLGTQSINMQTQFFGVETTPSCLC